MTEVLLEMAEDEFRAGRYTEAYDMAKLAKQLDPYFPTVDIHVAALRVYAVAYHYARRGEEPNWFQILGLPGSASRADVDRSFCRVGKLLEPEDNPSAAAMGAYRLISEAYEFLEDDDRRRELRRRTSGNLQSPAIRDDVSGASRVVGRGSCLAPSSMAHLPSSSDHQRGVRMIF